MYHFRKFASQGRMVSSSGMEFESLSLEGALMLAYELSGQCGTSVIVCRESNTNGNIAYVEVATVKCLP